MLGVGRWGRTFGTLCVLVAMKAFGSVGCGGPDPTLLDADASVGDDGPSTLPDGAPAKDGGGSDAPACPANLTPCGTVCADLSSSFTNCGQCGFACDPNLVCVAGHCADHCPAPKNRCPSPAGPVCVELDNDPKNCGACATVCPTEPNADPSCSHSVCGITCRTGFLDCDQNPVDGCEVNSAIDVNNCGACGNFCAPPPHAAATCLSDRCAMGACDPGWSDCNHNPVDGCESNVSADIANCGACGHACTVSGQSCVNGTCACPGGEASCGGICTSVLSDINNCGSCGHACTALSQTCTNGACTCPFPDTTICNNACTDTTSDINNCGTCNFACTVSGESCIGSVCTCPAGLSACSSGCTDTQTDPSNCGTCSHACSVVGETCSAGTCACPVGQTTICNNTCTSTQTDPNNCGSCNHVCGGGMSCVGGACATCSRTALVLGDTDTTSDANYQSMLQAQGFTVTVVPSGTTAYAGSPAASAFGVVIVSPGTTYATDMPLAGQQAIAAAAGSGGNTGVIFTSWAGYEYTNGRYQTLAPLILYGYSTGSTAVMTFTAVQTSHPIWIGLPASFSTTVSIGFNKTSAAIGLQNGGTLIASCPQCTADTTTGVGVAARDVAGQGRVVQIAHAAAASSVAWYSDPNLVKMMTNSALWAARCD